MRGMCWRKFSVGESVFNFFGSRSIDLVLCVSEQSQVPSLPCALERQELKLDLNIGNILGSSTSLTVLVLLWLIFFVYAKCLPLEAFSLPCIMLLRA